MTTRPTPRPKRGGEEFARGHYRDSENSRPKKPRFDIRNPSALAPDAPEEDIVLDADEIGKRGSRTKRNAVNIDGFESDSSNEGFDARAEIKAKEAKEAEKLKAGDEDDMFADLEEEFADGDEDQDSELEGKTKKQKKSVKFLEVEDIEGQSKRSKSGGHISGGHISALGEKDVESSSDSDVGDEVRAELDSDIDEELGAGAKKKHAPKIDAFNLEAEKEGGGFDEQMNYVRKAVDPDAVHDSWLEGVSKKDMKRAREAQEKRDQELRDKNRADGAILTADILRTLIDCLESGETVLAALARLGPKKKKPKWQNRKKHSEELQAEPSIPNDLAEKSRGQAVEAITGAADKLMDRGHNDIYDMQKETLIRHYEKETGDDWNDASQKDQIPSEPGILWEYRWSDARDGADAHGPYEAETMRAWNGAGYFGDGVEFRKLVEGGEWSPRATF